MNRSLALPFLILLLAAGQAFAQTGSDPAWEVLAGGKKGLYRIAMRQGAAEAGLIWDRGGAVRSIHPSEGGWYLLGSGGIFFSPDLRLFENRSAGLPEKTLKLFAEGTFRLAREPMDIKSLAIDPAQAGRLAACTATGIWYSEDSGKSWTSLGSPSPIPGFKAVSFGPWLGASRHVVWAAHSIKGLFVKDTGGKEGWINVTAGLPKVFGGNIEEVSSFALVPSMVSPGIGPAVPSWKFVAGLSFLGRILEWDQARKSFVEIYSDGLDFGAVESVVPAGEGLGLALSRGKVQRLHLSPEGGKSALSVDPALTGVVGTASGAVLAQHGDSTFCAALLPETAGDGLREGAIPIALRELWQLSGQEGRAGSVPSAAQAGADGTDPAARRRSLAMGRNGIYLQTGFVIDPSARARYFDLIKSLGLNSLVVDMKDDYGRLRFMPRSPLLSGMGGRGEVLDIESFAAEAKARGIYLIARIVVFKDEALYSRKNGSLAARDSTTGLPWRGIKPDGQPIQEHWVDPYSPEVWRYNVEIAREVTERGFDEVQFDYIRFPTDGENLASLKYPGQEQGMSPDSALESFLRFARQSLSVPLGIDIYGANGWYRSGTRTGQDVEMLSDYVDVISPMLYPSHFEQAFLAQAPAELRPYRIYRIGTLRNLSIARGKTLVRPYVQAFYLDVSYDRTYYGPSYVEAESRGVREGANQGMTYWNNSGRYTDLPLPR